MKVGVKFWMEYHKDSVVRLASSASLIHRNLCVARGLQSEESISYAVAHKATANIVHVTEGASTQQEAIDYEATKDKDTMAFLTQVSRPINLCSIFKPIFSIGDNGGHSLE
jgi:glycerol-3-phosphate dehydrogenase